MYHVNEFSFSPRNHHPRVVGAYTAATLPEGRVVSRDGNAIRIEDPAHPGLVVIVSRPWAEGDIFPLPLHEEDLGWAFGAQQSEAGETAG